MSGKKTGTGNLSTCLYRTRFFVPLVDAIREKTDDPDDQVRIAVSLVQQIPYDQEMLDKGTLEIRYPYQTLLDNKGVCCEKSVLLPISFINWGMVWHYLTLKMRNIPLSGSEQPRNMRIKIPDMRLSRLPPH